MVPSVNDKRYSATATTRLDEGDTATYAIATAVAKAEDVTPVELTPLAKVIDTDSMNKLVTAMLKGSAPIEAVEVSYHGYDVTVTTDGTVVVEET